MTRIGWNECSHPFVWTKTADQILAKANRRDTVGALCVLQPERSKTERASEFQSLPNPLLGSKRRPFATGDEGADLGVEVLDGCEHSSADGLALDDAEPDLDEVHPGGARRSEVDLEPGCLASHSRTFWCLCAA